LIRFAQDRVHPRPSGSCLWGDSLRDGKDWVARGTDEKDMDARVPKQADPVLIRRFYLNPGCAHSTGDANDRCRAVPGRTRNISGPKSQRWLQPAGLFKGWLRGMGAKRIETAYGKKPYSPPCFVHRSHPLLRRPCQEWPPKGQGCLAGISKIRPRLLVPAQRGEKSIPHMIAVGSRPACNAL
jgi:hypothetical protein